MSVLAAVLCMSGPAGQWLRDGRLVDHGREDWRGAIAWVNGATEAPTWPVFVRSGLIESDALRAGGDPQLREYCLLPVGGPYRLGAESRQIIPLPYSHSGRLTGEQLSLIVDHGGAWLLIRGGRETADQILTDVLAGLRHVASEGHVVDRRAFDQVHVVRLSVVSNNNS